MADKILASRAALEGERKQVTVLFADVVGSSELIRDRDTEEAQRLLDGAVKVMMDAVHRYEGTVSRALGDGIMALFGAPLAHEDHAVRACYAALTMRDAMRAYSEEVRRAHGIAVEIRVGLNSGEVVVRLVSDDLHMDYTALGQTVHLASRMEQVAAGGSIRLTAGTLALVEGYVQVRSLGPIPIKGISEPVNVYELVGVGAIRTRLQASAARGLTRFVGRHAEVDLLHATLERVKAGHGQVVALVGEPGMGKSRLVREVTHSHRAQGWTILETGSVAHGRATSYLPIVDLLRAYCQVEADDDERTIREKATVKLLDLGQSLGATLPAVLSLLDVAVEDAAWEALDPSQRRRQTLDSIKRLLLRESQERPLLLVVEDLHWIDEQTEALLDALVESLPTVRLLLLVNYRPEYRHDWGNKTYYSQVRIDRLPSESAAELLHALLGGDLALEPLKRLLIERTEGNPFFLEESVRMLVEEGILAGEQGACRLTTVMPSVRVPGTVQAVLAARIDRLPPEDKRLLQTAAVVGKDLPLALLHAVVELPDDALHGGLARLQAAEFLYEAALFPEPEYTFKHALTHEVAYGSLLQDRRRALHARIAAAIEALHADRLAEHVERLAYHALRGEVWDKALAHGRLAGEKAIARSSYREAVAWFERALEALARLPASRESREQSIDLRLGLRPALNALGEHRRLLEHVREAERIAEALGDRRRLGHVLSIAANTSWHLGDHDRAIQAGERAGAIGEALGDVGLRVAANFQLAPSYMDQGHYHKAIEGLRWNVVALDGDLLRERFGLGAYPAVSSRGLLAMSLAELGEFAEAVTHAEDAVRVAEALDHPISQVFACYMLAHAFLRRGQPGEVTSTLERGLALCRRWNLSLLSLHVIWRLGRAYILAGRAADGLAFLEQAIEVATSMETATDAAIRAGWLSEAYLANGRYADAVRCAERALDLSVARGERANQADALRLLGELGMHHEPPDAAALARIEDHYRQALALAEELGMRPLQAHCHLGLGTLYRKVGRLDEARAELATAVEMLRSMDMAYWLPQAEAELAEVTGPPSVKQVG